MQATHDSGCKFRAACSTAPGGASDSVAIRNANLPEMAVNLPLACHVVGDNACTCAENLLTSHSAINKNEPSQRTVSTVTTAIAGSKSNAPLNNLLQSDTRQKLGPLCKNLDNAARIFHCTTRLHNCCIDNGDAVSTRRSDNKKEAVEFCQASSTKLKEEDPTRASH